MHPQRPTLAGLREVTVAGLGGGPLDAAVTGYRRGIRGLVHGDPACRRIPARDRGRLPDVPVDLTAVAAGTLPDPCGECFEDLIVAAPGAVEHLRAAVALLRARESADTADTDPAGDPVAAAWSIERLTGLRAALDRLDPPAQLAAATAELTARVSTAAQRLAAETRAVADPDGAAHAAAVHLVAAHAAWQSNREQLTGDHAERYLTVLGNPHDVAGSLSRTAVAAWRHTLGGPDGAVDRLAAAARAAELALLGERATGDPVDPAVLRLLRPTRDPGEYPNLAAYVHAEVVDAQRLRAGELIGSWAPLYRRVRAAAATRTAVVACWPVPDRSGAPQHAIARLWGHRVPDDRLPGHDRPDAMHVAVLPLAAALIAVAEPAHPGYRPRRAAILGAARAEDTDPVLELAVRFHLEAVEVTVGTDTSRWDRDTVADPAPSPEIADTAALVAARGVLAPPG